jgi:PAS domain S-box-containing protein
MGKKDIYRNLVENALDGIYVVSQEGFEFVNPAFEKLVGYTFQEICDRKIDPFELIHPDDRKFVRERKMHRKKGHPLPSCYEFRVVTREGDTRHVEANTVSFGKSSGVVLGCLRDITSQVLSDRMLRESEEKYRNLIERASDGIAIIQDWRFRYANPRLREICGYSWEELLNAPFSLCLSPEQFSRLVERYDHRKQAEDAFSNYETALVNKSGQEIPVELSAAAISYEGSPAELVFIHDISERKHNEKNLYQTLEKLRRTMNATIQAITLTVEAKDPYTAGHQRRVSDLARSIATEIGLDSSQIDSIRTAAAIHDLGKIAIPGEILSKPGKINEMEWQLIKSHPQVGYQILKNIEFSGPVAQVVLQHHERLNGSGYPQGLKNNDILLEARIVGVADVVEAMISHRPYRSAHTIDEALDEISSKRGTLYDCAAVEACTALFRHKGYELQMI